MKQTNIYVDGFNLYHNSLKKKNLYWLNIKALVEKSLKGLTEQYSIHQIKYFTSPIRFREWEPNLKDQQELYIKVLTTLPNLQIIMGRFSITPQSCPTITNESILAHWRSFSVQKQHKLLNKIQGYFQNKTIQEIKNQLVDDSNQEILNRLWKKFEYKDKIKLVKRLFEKQDTTIQKYVKIEEKGTDVNLATHLLLDAFDSAYDCAVIISNDSDFELPIQKVIEKFKKQIVLLIPGSYISKELKSVIEQSDSSSANKSFYKYIKESDLRHSQFPDAVNGIPRPKN